MDSISGFITNKETGVANENRNEQPGRFFDPADVVIVIGALYFARVVFIPFSLAVLLAFLLAPLTVRLRHWGLGKVLVFRHCGRFFLRFNWGYWRVHDLLNLQVWPTNMPEYEQNIRQKVQTLKSSGGGMISPHDPHCAQCHG
jgi:predicted PurR-regulated permease PerM